MGSAQISLGLTELNTFDAVGMQLGWLQAWAGPRHFTQLSAQANKPSWDRRQRMQKSLSYHACQLRHRSSNTVGGVFSLGSSSLLPCPVENWLHLHISILRCWQFLGGKPSILVCFSSGFGGKLINTSSPSPPITSKNGKNVCIYSSERMCHWLSGLQVDLVFYFFKVHKNYNLPGTWATGNKCACENLGKAMPE